MLKILQVAGLAWGDAVIDATFFIVQIYLSQVWKLNFTAAASFLNIWGGVYKVLPLLFLFIADTLLGNFWMLAVSGITSTMGLMSITVGTTPLTSAWTCQEKDGVGRIEKALFFTGMALVALGRAARFASTEAFIKDQNGDHGSNPNKGCLVISGIVFFVTPFVGIFAFPYVKNWSFLFGASALCTSSATLFYLEGYHTYNKPKPRAEGSPLTDIARVFVAAIFFKRSLQFPKDNEREETLYVVREEQFQKLSPSTTLGFLHKAAIIVDGDKDVGSGEVKKRSWKVCSVSEVESTKIMIRLVPMWSVYLMCGVVSSIGNTYIVEQMSHMKSNIGSWKVPPQVVLLIFTIFKYSMSAFATGDKLELKEGKTVLGKVLRDGGALQSGSLTVACTVICCAVAAAVERRRLHLIHHLPDHDQITEAPMSAFWLMFPFAFLAIIDTFLEFSLSRFHQRTPDSMERYRDGLSEGVIGYGYMCGALSVYVVGKISEMGSSKGWFQDVLNRSRLDRYYWVLTILASFNLIFFLGMGYYNYRARQWKESEVYEETVEADKDFKKETAFEIFGIKKSSAAGIILRYFPGADNFVGSVIAWFRQFPVFSIYKS